MANDQLKTQLAQTWQEYVLDPGYTFVVEHYVGKLGAPELTKDQAAKFFGKSFTAFKELSDPAKSNLYDTYLDSILSNLAGDAPDVFVWRAGLIFGRLSMTDRAQRYLTTMERLVNATPAGHPMSRLYGILYPFFSLPQEEKVKFFEPTRLAITRLAETNPGVAIEGLVDLLYHLPRNDRPDLCLSIFDQIKELAHHSPEKGMEGMTKVFCMTLDPDRNNLFPQLAQAIANLAQHHRSLPLVYLRNGFKSLSLQDRKQNFGCFYEHMVAIAQGTDSTIFDLASQEIAGSIKDFLQADILTPLVQVTSRVDRLTPSQAQQLGQAILSALPAGSLPKMLLGIHANPLENEKSDLIRDFIEATRDHGRTSNMQPAPISVSNSPAAAIG